MQRCHDDSMPGESLTALCSCTVQAVVEHVSDTNASPHNTPMTSALAAAVYTLYSACSVWNASRSCAAPAVRALNLVNLAIQ